MSGRTMQRRQRGAPPPHRGSRQRRM